MPIGSPPRMRGEHGAARCATRDAGITPAYAGRTSYSDRQVRSRRDHPRVCGENRPAFRRRLAAARITPAYAGRTLDHSAGRRRIPDHPRVCGENWLVKDLISVEDGSPPRMRGERPIGQARLRQARITPAYAGRTCTSRSTPTRTPDHPRVCGENDSWWASAQSRHWITPAYAGRTVPTRSRSLMSRDHPRVCGENHPDQLLDRLDDGSPPRMRGELTTRRCRRGGFRITPAYAGRTPAEASLSPCRTDHPRVCGENLSQSAIGDTFKGSPPRMRGERTQERILVVMGRITPAYAGRTSSS